MANASPPDVSKETISSQHCPDVSCFTEENQEARSFLRERFLRCISGFLGSKCELSTVENSVIHAEYNGMDINVQDIFLKNLVTPMSTQKAALVRTSDVINMHLSCIKLKLEEEKNPIETME